MKDKPIAFFDSGIGGATILKEVIKKLPKEKYIYLPDFENNPYGNKSKDELFDIVDNCVKKLLEFDPKIIVCACNTATAMVLDDIRDKYQDVIFVGTEPAVKVVYDKYSDEKCIILTTKGTGDSERFNSLFNKYKTSECTLVEAPRLAELIETNQDTLPYLRSLLSDYRGTKIVVLGCTHFPLVKKEITEILGSVRFIDGSVGIANRVHYLLKENDMLGDDSFELNILTGDENTKDKIISIIKS